MYESQFIFIYQKVYKKTERFDMDKDPMQNLLFIYAVAVFYGWQEIIFPVSALLSLKSI